MTCSTERLFCCACLRWSNIFGFFVTYSLYCQSKTASQHFFIAVIRLRPYLQPFHSGPCFCSTATCLKDRIHSAFAATVYESAPFPGHRYM